MAELAPGEKSWMKMLKPPPGYFTCKAVEKRLGVGNEKFRKYCADLGIELTPFVRDEPYVKKVYKKKFRWLTEEEVRRLIEHRHAMRG